MPISRARKIGLATTLTGALFGAAVGSWLGSRAYRPVDDLSKPKYTETVSYESGPVNYTFKKGDTVWSVAASKYGLTDNHDIAEKVNYVAKREAPNHKHHGNHLLKDTKAVVKGKVVNQSDRIRGDEIQAGDTLTFPDVPKAVKVKNPHGKIVGYEQKLIVDKPYGWLGGLLGGLAGLGVYYGFLRKRYGTETPPEAPVAPDGGPAGPGGHGDAPDRPDHAAEPEVEVAPFPRRVGGREGGEPRNYSSNLMEFNTRGRRRLNDFELTNARRDIGMAYRNGRSVSSTVKDYVGLSTRDGYRMIAEEKLTTPGTIYKWNRTLATETGDLSAVERMVLDGRNAGKSASQITKEIKDATGFEMSRSTVYRMHKKLTEAERLAA